MTFSDMTPARRVQVENWAQSHDWGRGAFMVGGRELIGCVCEVVDRDGAVTLEHATFTDLASLRDWAGY
jgi:hypothetical protein